VNHYYPGADDEEELIGRQVAAGGLEAAAAWRRALRLVSQSQLSFEEGNRSTDMSTAVPIRPFRGSQQNRASHHRSGHVCDGD
jgi:hypothetical protein